MPRFIYQSLVLNLINASKKLVIFFLIAIEVPLSAQIPSCLDQTFGVQGRLTLNVGSHYEEGVAIGYQSDGKMVVLGQGKSSFFLQRYDVNGIVDTTFANMGYWSTDKEYFDKMFSLIVLPNDNILIAGVTYINQIESNAIIKFLPSGEPDSTFGIHGQYAIPLPNNFSPNSTHLVPLPDSKFMAIAHFNSKLALALFNNNGSIDTNFGNDGILEHPSGFSATAIKFAVSDSSGTLWIGGSNSHLGNWYFLQKFKSDGSVDNNFGNNGQILGKYNSTYGTNSVKDLIPLKDGSLLVLGENNSFSHQLLVLSKFKSDGTPDTFFGNGGIIVDTLKVSTGTVSDLLILPDGDLLIGGRMESEMIILKYSANGILKTDYGEGGVLRITYGPISYNQLISLLWHPFINRVQILGYTIGSYPQKDVADPDNIFNNDVDITLTRLMADGSIDNSYGYHGKSSSSVFNADEEAVAIAIQGDGKVVLALYETHGGYASTILMRMNNDGSHDRSFGNFGKIRLIYFLMKSNDGLKLHNNKILLAGDSFRGLTVFRLTNNGLPDSTFNVSGFNAPGEAFIPTTHKELYSLTTAGYALDVHNGKILVSGCDQCIGFSDFLTVRFLENGNLDTSFGSEGVVISSFGNSDDIATHLKVRANGKIIVIGKSETNISTLSILQLHDNGTPDNTFGSGGKVVTTSLNEYSWPSSALLLENDKILISGPNDISAIQLLKDGTFDLTFSNDGFIKRNDDLPASVNLNSAMWDGKQVVLGGEEEYDEEIVLAFVSADGHMSATCGTSNQVFQSDMFINESENLIDMKLDSEGKLWAFGTRGQPGSNIYSDIFLLRFNDLSTHSKDLKKDAESFSLYPNPAENSITVQTTNLNSNDLIFEIRNALGVIVVPQQLIPDNFEINISSLVKGLYFFTLKNNMEMLLTQFVKI